MQPLLASAGAGTLSANDEAEAGAEAGAEAEASTHRLD